jgi:hypothetical protein
MKNNSNEENLIKLSHDLVNKILFKTMKKIVDPTVITDGFNILIAIKNTTSIENLKMVKMIFNPLPNLERVFNQIIDKRISELENPKTSLSECYENYVAALNMNLSEKAKEFKIILLDRIKQCDSIKEINLLIELNLLNPVDPDLSLALVKKFSC